MDNSRKEPHIPLERLNYRSSELTHDVFNVYDSNHYGRNQNHNKIQSNTQSFNTGSESSTNINGSLESNDESISEPSFIRAPRLDKINSVASVVSQVLEKKALEKAQKENNIATKRKVKEFDVEKLKPFFIQFEDPVQEITELDLCNNILLFVMVISGLSLVFLFGIGVAKLTSLAS